MVFVASELSQPLGRAQRRVSWPVRAWEFPSAHVKRRQMFDISLQRGSLPAGKEEWSSMAGFGNNFEYLGAILCVPTAIIWLDFNGERDCSETWFRVCCGLSQR